MPKPRACIDTSAFILGLEQPDSNAALLLRLAAQHKVQFFAAEKLLEELRSFYRIQRGERFAYFAELFARKSLRVLPRGDIAEEVTAWRGKIKEKDLEHLATVKKLGLPLVAYDRDFDPFPEYQTPKEFVVRLGLKPKPTPF